MMKKSGVIKEKWQYAIYAILALGVAVCLTGALLMWDGSILGENHAGIATIVGIIGIGLLIGGIGLLGTFTAVNAAIASQRRRG